MATRREARPHSTGSRDPDREETVSAPATAIATILATVVGVAALSVGADALRPGLVAAVAGCLLTGLVTAANRRTPGGRAVGGVLTVLAAVALTGAIALAALEDGASSVLAARVAVVVAIAIATFGATATVTGAVGDGAVRAAIPIAVGTSIPIAVVSVLYTEALRSLWLERDVGVAASAVTDSLFSPQPGIGALVTFVLVLTGTLWLVSVVVPRLPLPELVARDRRADVRERMAAIRSGTRWSGLAALSIGLAVAATIAVADSIVETVDDHTDSYAPHVETVLEGLESGLLVLATTPAVRLALFAIVAVFCVLYAVSRLPALGRVRHSRFLPWLPVFVGGAIVALLLLVAYPPLFESVLRPALVDLGFASNDGGLEEPASLLAPPNGIAVAAVATTTVVGLVTGLLGAIWLTGAIALLPDRAPPGALGAGALVIGSLFVALEGASPTLIAVPVACAIVAWDAASYGVGITDELARDVPARRPALVHVTGTAVVVVVSIALALGLRAAAAAVTVRTGITIVLSLTVALLAVWIVLKRRATRHASESDPSSRDETAHRAGAPHGGPDRMTGDQNRFEPNQIDRTVDERNRSDASGESTWPNEPGPGADRPISERSVAVAGYYELRCLEAAGFETVGDLQVTPVDELAAVEGIHQSRAAKIKRAVHGTLETDETDISPIED